MESSSQVSRPPGFPFVHTPSGSLVFALQQVRHHEDVHLQIVKTRLTQKAEPLVHGRKGGHELHRQHPLHLAEVFRQMVLYLRLKTAQGLQVGELLHGLREGRQGLAELFGAGCLFLRKPKFFRAAKIKKSANYMKLSKGKLSGCVRTIRQPMCVNCFRRKLKIEFLFYNGGNFL